MYEQCTGEGMLSKTFWGRSTQLFVFFFAFFAFLHVLFMVYHRCNKEIGIIQCLAEEVSSGKDSKSRFR